MSWLFASITLLPLDDCLYALQATVPALIRSSLHRCLPEVEGENPHGVNPTVLRLAFHPDIAELRTAEGKFHLFVAIDRTSKLAFVQLLDRADMTDASGFLEALIEAVPY